MDLKKHQKYMRISKKTCIKCVNLKLVLPYILSSCFFYRVHHLSVFRETSVNLDFGHAETVLPIVTAFGLSNNSKPLLADNYHLNKDRKYKESLIAPFSANIAIALYRCSVSNDHVIKIFLNEAEVTIPACGQNICTYSDFKSFYNSLANCNFDKICENSTNPPPVG